MRRTVGCIYSSSEICVYIAHLKRVFVWRCSFCFFVGTWFTFHKELHAKNKQTFVTIQIKSIFLSMFSTQMHNKLALSVNLYAFLLVIKIMLVAVLFTLSFVWALMLTYRISFRFYTQLIHYYGKYFKYLFFAQNFKKQVVTYEGTQLLNLVRIENAQASENLIAYGLHNGFVQFFYFKCQIESFTKKFFFVAEYQISSSHIILMNYFVNAVSH